MRTYKQYILFFLLFLSYNVLLAQEDSTAVESIIDQYEKVVTNKPNRAVDFGEVDTLISTSKTIDEETIDDYLNNPDFQYKKKGNLKVPRNNWLNRFIDAIVDLLEKSLGFLLPPWLFQVLQAFFIIAVIFGAIYLLARFLGLKVNFKRKKKPKVEDISFESLEENLEEVDFDSLLQQAIKEGSYRVATRLFFLKNLQSLTKREHINWAIDKTNNDYKYELASSNLLQGFEETVYLFEHIWYGHFELSEVEFQQAINTFRNFQTAIINEK